MFTSIREMAIEELKSLIIEGEVHEDHLPLDGGSPDEALRGFRIEEGQLIALFEGAGGRFCVLLPWT